MRVSTKVVLDIETGTVLARDSYCYFGPVDLFCFDGDSAAKALEKSQVAFTNVLNADYSQSYAEQQQLLQQQTARMNYIAANPMGYTPRQLATATTSINENTAAAAKQAIGAAAAYAASHGGADTGSGAIGQVAGQIGSAAAQSKAQSLASLSQQNEGLKQQNFWTAISGLNNVGNELGGSAGTAIGGATGTANSAVNAGQLALASSQAGWQNLAGVMSGIGGLATGIGGAATGLAKLGVSVQG